VTTTETTLSAATKGGARRPSRSQRRAWRITTHLLDRVVVGEVRLVTPDGATSVHGAPGTALTATMVVRDWEFFPRLVHGGSVGAGESYFLGDWDCDDLVALVRIVIANRPAFRRITASAIANIVIDRVLHGLNANRLGRSKANIAAHYDLSNELYALFLDPTMTYSCAYFEHPSASLEQAQIAKYDRIARKARLAPGMRVLEVGCGWGGFAMHAARTYGCHVTGITLSEEQASFARAAVAAAGLNDLVDIRIVDYREVQGTYDRVVSIEMLEAVGHRYLGRYFSDVDRVLGPDGVAVIQVITIPEQRERSYRRRPDYIQRYIFPGGYLPSLAAMTTAMGRSSRLYVDEVENLAMHYAETLRLWRERFLAARDSIIALGFDEAFVRRWEFYFAYCEGAFLARYIGDLQLVLTRPMSGALGTDAYRGAAPPVVEADLEDAGPDGASRGA